ncbi:MAG: response regulator transcription factor [Bacteroidales bacterium]|nr:response regulator transcription factor [Bacteroidales bacterium]
MGNWILMVDNNPNNFEASKERWLKHRIFIKTVTSLPEAIKLLTKMDFLLVIIVTSGLEYLSYLQIIRDMKPMPILVVSPKHIAHEKIKALQLGADEYLAGTPVNEGCIASGKALIRRYTVLNHQAEKPLTIITYHDVFICVEYRRLFLKDQEIMLTRKEFDLVHFLFSSIGRVYTHEQIFMHVWGDEMKDISENYAIWSLVTRIRKKFRSTSDSIDYIKTVRDVGYCIDTILE